MVSIHKENHVGTNHKISSFKGKLTYAYDLLC